MVGNSLLFCRDIMSVENKVVSLGAPAGRRVYRNVGLLYYVAPTEQKQPVMF